MKRITLLKLKFKEFIYRTKKKREAKLLKVIFGQVLEIVDYLELVDFLIDKGFSKMEEHDIPFDLLATSPSICRLVKEISKTSEMEIVVHDNLKGFPDSFVLTIFYGKFESKKKEPNSIYLRGVFIANIKEFMTNLQTFANQ